jgi:hypothetical protein
MVVGCELGARWYGEARFLNLNDHKHTGLARHGPDMRAFLVRHVHRGYLLHYLLALSGEKLTHNLARG